MNKSFNAIAPANFKVVWQEIKHEVASIKSPDGGIPEDVYFMCMKGDATLFLLFVDNERVGWVLLRLLGTDLHIWETYAKNGANVLEIFREDLMAVARQARATKLTFGSSRAAWQKVAISNGFKPRMTVYECDIDPMPNQAAVPGNATVN